jgi:hypothetical protein
VCRGRWLSQTGLVDRMNSRGYGGYRRRRRWRGVSSHGPGRESGSEKGGRGRPFFVIFFLFFLSCCDADRFTEPELGPPGTHQKSPERAFRVPGPKKRSQTKPNQKPKAKSDSKGSLTTSKGTPSPKKKSNHAHSKTVIRSNPFNPVLQQGGLTRRGLFLRVPSIFTRSNFVELQSGSGVGSWELAVGSRKSKVGRWNLGVEVGAKTACGGVVIRSRGMRSGHQIEVSLLRLTLHRVSSGAMEIRD